MHLFDVRIQKELDKRNIEGELRTLNVQSHLVDFYSNDYLGFAKVSPVSTNAEVFPASSRLIAGTFNEHLHLESFLADFFDVEATLIYNSGYTANIGLISTVANKNDLIVYDEKCHASIKDGIRLSKAKALKFKHNSSEDLDRILKNHPEFKIESVTAGFKCFSKFKGVENGM